MTLNLLSLVGFALLLAVGQFLFKRSALAIAGQDATASLATLATLPSFYAAILLYGGSTVLWVWILTRVPLSLAYPFVAVAMIVVPAMGWYFFGERLNLAYWLGAALIIAGMLVMQFAA
jgi:drug/metabolite transporter (DMT)-like permease